MKIFVLLGKNGKIAKSLYSDLNESKNIVLSIKWKDLNDLLIKGDSLEKYILNKIYSKKKVKKIILINCLNGEVNLDITLNLINLINQSLKKFNISYSYIFLSTYEPC